MRTNGFKIGAAQPARQEIVLRIEPRQRIKHNFAGGRVCGREEFFAAGYEGHKQAKHATGKANSPVLYDRGIWDRTPGLFLFRQKARHLRPALWADALSHLPAIGRLFDHTILDWRFLVTLDAVTFEFHWKPPHIVLV
jgi:hypothetical protein